MAGSTDVVVKFLADVSDIKGGVDKIDSSISKVGSGLKKAAIGIGAAMAGVFAVNQVQEWVGAAEEAESVSNGLSKAMENAGDATGDWWRNAEKLASTLQYKTGIDDEVIKKGQTILATFHNLSGAAGQQSGAFDRATRAALDMSKAGFGTVESASTMLGKALEDPIKGITALGKAGVTFSADQKAAIKAMVESGDKAGAMNLILQNVEGQVGGVAEATATASDKMSVAWGDTQEALGSLLLPVLQELAPVLGNIAFWIQDVLVPALKQYLGPALDTIAKFVRNDVIPWLGDKLGTVIEKVAGWVTDDLVPAFQAFGGWLADNREGIQSVTDPLVRFGLAIAALLPVIAALVVLLAEKLAPVFSIIGDWVTEHQDIWPAMAIGLGAVGAVILVSLIPAFIAWAAAALAAAAATLLAIAPFAAIGIAVAALAYLIISNWDTIKAVTQAVWNAVLGFITGVWDWISSNWPLLLAILTGPFGLATRWIITNWQGILDFFKGIPGLIAGFFVGLGDILLAPFRWAWGEIIKVKDGIVGVWQSAIQGAKDIWNTFARFWNGINVTIGGQDPLGPLGPSIPEVNLRLPHIDELAAGGIVTRPTLAMIGERGPEAVIPLGADTAGSTTIIVNVTTTGLGADAPSIQRAVVAALRGHVSRNGPLTGIAS